MALTKVQGGMLSGGPAFCARLTTDQVISAGATTKFILSTEVFDTASCYDPTTYRFTPNVAGYYQINFSTSNSQASNLNTRYSVILYKNGAAYQQLLAYNNTSGDYQVVTLSTLVYMNGTTDYLEMYGNPTAQPLTFFITQPLQTAFSGFLAVAA